LLSTILDLIGLANETHSMHGMSFLPVLRGESNEHRKFSISGYHEAVDRAIRDESWSYVERPENEPDELYNLKRDPREVRNLVDEEPEEAKRLASAFGQYFRRKERTSIKGIQGRYELSDTALG